MSTDLEKLYQNLLTLSDKDRAEMAASLIDSLDSVRDADVEAAWENEIERRLLEIDQGTVKMISWPDARRMILRDSD
ncbi:MAG: addiction module protein [Bdellovibrionales bacterium]|nr:addiction module protein [Bdellovibrionales bacterium]